jgi:hypothetical protein
MDCPKCKAGLLSRVKRQGFLENKFLSRLGYFPWECATCRRRIRVKTRGWTKPDSSNPQAA